MDVSGKRQVCKDLGVFDSVDGDVWEKLYQTTITPKYRKGTRNFTTKVTGKAIVSSPTVFIIPRVRGGPSYKLTPLEGIDDNEAVQYCPISKGFPMQDVSSFTLGPVVGEGLCVVNAAFSKVIYLQHLIGGRVDYRRKNFWRPQNTRSVEYVDEILIVDGVKHQPIDWLTNNRDLWEKNWEEWRRSIALCSEGSFHWGDGMGPVITYKTPKGSKVEFEGFVDWKYNSYINPARELIPLTREYKFMRSLIDKNIPIALLHPMGSSGNEERPMTKEQLRELFDDPYEMSCMPFVVAYMLLSD